MSARESERERGQHSERIKDQRISSVRGIGVGGQRPASRLPGKEGLSTLRRRRAWLA